MKGAKLLKVHPLLTERVRLALLVALASSEDGLEFTELLDSLELTRGNLASHARRLEDAGLLRVKKEFINRKPCTTFSCSKEGKIAIQDYLKIVETTLKELNK